MPAPFLSTSVVMTDQVRDQRWLLTWGFGASVALHLVVAALLLFELPEFPMTEEEQAIDVAIVPPPEPEEKPEAEPPPPAPEPTPEKPEEAKAEPPPPAPEPPPEKPEEAKVEPPPAAGEDAAPQQSMPTLRPVVQFGEKNAGPRQALDGDSGQEGSPSEDAAPEAETKDTAGQPVVTAANSDNKIPLPGEPAEKAPEAKPAAEAQKSPELREAKRLFSPYVTGDSVATTAMGDLPRAVRAGELCATELRQQLQYASPPYLPASVPRYVLEKGTVLQARRAAFSGGGQWRDVSFRCEVDAEATRVVSFAFGVGDIVPPSEWKSRRLPPP